MAPHHHRRREGKGEREEEEEEEGVDEGGGAPVTAAMVATIAGVGAGVGAWTGAAGEDDTFSAWRPYETTREFGACRIRASRRVRRCHVIYTFIPRIDHRPQSVQQVRVPIIQSIS